MPEEYVMVEDKASGSFMIIRLSDTTNDIICRAKSKFWALDIMRAMNSVFGGEEGRDGINQ